MKKCLATLLVLLMLASVPVIAFADDTVYSEGTLYYTINNESVTIVGCFGKRPRSPFRPASRDIP